MTVEREDSVSVDRWVVRCECGDTLPKVPGHLIVQLLDETGGATLLSALPHKTEPAKARCNVIALTGLDGHPAKTIDGRQWYGCLSCERTFTESHPTVDPSVCFDRVPDP